MFGGRGLLAMRRWFHIAALLGLVALTVVMPFVFADEPVVQEWNGENPHITEIERHHTPSTVIFPEQTIPLRFFHDKHLAAEIDCDSCHEDIADSTRASDVNLPGGDVCANCHYVDEENPEKADPPSACNSCHLGFDEKYNGTDPHDEPEGVPSHPVSMRIPEPHLKFNHKVHIDRDIACSTCHGDMTKIETASPENAIPVMGTCLDCHTGKEAPGDCGTCHITRPDGRLVTDFPEGKLKPHGYYRNDFHNEYFIQNHEQVAREDEGYCNNCHTRDECVDCHNGVVRPVKIHPANWILTHPIQTRKNALECTSCHREQSFCIDCHRRTGITHLSENMDTTVEFHPPGWVNGFGELPSANHHMFQAQRNIRACVSCHEEQTCIQCHSAKDPVGFGVQRSLRHNPHPVDFKSRCKTMASMNERACMKCHQPNDPWMSLCR